MNDGAGRAPDANAATSVPAAGGPATGADLAATQQRARARLAASAQAYVTSVSHAEGDELPRLVEAVRSRLRDPSHVEAYRVSTWMGWLGAAGLEPYLLERGWRVKPLTTWSRRADTAPEKEAALWAFLDSPDGDARRFLIAPGAGPFVQGNEYEARLRRGRAAGRHGGTLVSRAGRAGGAASRHVAGVPASAPGARTSTETRSPA